jgi:hypothetical protein
VPPPALNPKRQLRIEERRQPGVSPIGPEAALALLCGPPSLTLGKCAPGRRTTGQRLTGSKESCTFRGLHVGPHR